MVFFSRAVGLGSIFVATGLPSDVLLSDPPADPPTCDRQSQADCSRFPACADLQGRCCPTESGNHLWCCNPTADSVLGAPQEQQRIRYSPSAVQPQGVVRLPPSLPPASAGMSAPRARETLAARPPEAAPPPWAPAEVPAPDAALEAQLDRGAPCARRAAPRTFADGDCVVARGEIEYASSQGELTVSVGSLGTVVSVEPLGVMWRGHDALTNAEVKPEQIAFPEPREGKILAIHRSATVEVLCLAAVRVSGAEASFAASVKPVPCLQDSEDQVFLMMPCGTGSVRLSNAEDTCMELVHPQLTLLKPCHIDAVDGQIFQLQVRSKRFQAGVGGFVGCYALSGANLDELLLLPCEETSTEFSFIDRIAR